VALFNTRAQEIRGQVASLAYRGGVQLEEILQACTWKSRYTFTDFYLKELSRTAEGRCKLGLIVTAQHIISS